MKENLLNIFLMLKYFLRTQKYFYLILFSWIAVDISGYYRQNYFRYSRASLSWVPCPEPGWERWMVRRPSSVRPHPTHRPTLSESWSEDNIIKKCRKNDPPVTKWLHCHCTGYNVAPVLRENRSRRGRATRAQERDP